MPEDETIVSKREALLEHYSEATVPWVIRTTVNPDPSVVRKFWANYSPLLSNRQHLLSHVLSPHWAQTTVRP